MKTLVYLKKSLPILFLFLSVYSSYAQNTISGTVTDNTGEPLIGANVLVKGTTDGTITDFDGTFNFTTGENYPLTIVVSFTGFTSQELVVTGPTDNLTITLAEGVVLGEDVVISASRKREKVQEAPASISVVGARRLEATPQVSPVRQLVATPGVQIQQQSAGRINIEMRASSGIFGTSVFPIKDYRSLVAPGLGVFQSDGAGLSNIDLERIEVVRGPGSALYGPGVTSGVVHFITKNPIDHPGTAVQVYGGEKNTFGGAIRHAGANSSKTFGYKINVTANRGDEFKLDGSEGTLDAAGNFTSQFDKFKTSVGIPGITNGRVDGSKPSTKLFDLTPDENGNVMADEFENISGDLTLEFRPKDNLSITLASGYSNASAVFYNDLGEGLAQSSEIWTQARMQAGGLFAQVFFVDNNGGSDSRPTFLYQTGNISPIGRKQLEGQLQYNFDTPSILDANWTVGADYRSAINDTRNVTYGKNEDIDDYNIYGAYVQGKFGLADKLDMVLAGRYDRFNFLDEGFFSPRAAFVFKASPKHTFRASYNLAGSPATGLETYIDFPVNVVVPGVLDFWLSGQNNVQSFGDNPMIEFINQGFVAQAAAPQVASLLGIPLEQAAALTSQLAGLLPDQLPANVLGSSGIPNSIIHQVASAALLQQLQANGLSALVPTIQAYLQANTVPGSTGTFVGVNAFENNTLLNELIPSNDAVIRRQTTWEVGYKGLLTDKFSMSLDIYRQTDQGFTDFTQIAPLISLQNPDVKAFTDYAQGLAATLIQAGVPQQAAVALAGAYGGAATLVPNFYNTGTVETDQVPQNDGITHVAAGYRIFPDAKATFWGSDLGLQYFATSDLSFFGNYSWVSKTSWQGEELGETTSPLSRYLNVPKNKFRLGMTYAPEAGFRANMVFQHDDSFFASVGQYTGQTDEKNLIDAGVGYKFDNGLSLDLTAQNLFNNKYRTFVNMPQIGRRVLAKITYQFQ